MYVCLKGPSKEEVLKKVAGLVEELLKDKSVEQAVSAYREARVPERLVSDALASVLGSVLDKPDTDKEVTMDWVAALRKDTLLSHTQVSANGIQFYAGCSNLIHPGAGGYDLVLGVGVWV